MRLFSVLSVQPRWLFDGRKKNKVRDGSSRNAISLWLELDFMKQASFMFGEEE